MDFLTNAVAFVIALGVIIFVHEAGHLLVAKAFGVRVLAFSLGFGKRLFGFRRGETEYRVSMVPLGGYVRLGGENPDEISDDPREFLNKPRWQRILVYVAGPAMNVVLAILLMAGLFAVGTSVVGDVGRDEAMVGAVAEGLPAAEAGLRPGDVLVSVDGKAVSTWQDFATEVSFSPGEPLELGVERGGERFHVTVVPVKVEPYGFGDVGVIPRLVPRVLQVVEGAPAAAAGLREGDQILTVDGRPVAGTGDLIASLEKHPGQEIVLGVRRGSKRLDVALVPEANDAGVGKIGALIGPYVRYPLGQAFVASVRFNWD
ncbi:MAG TPA: site-2 protease family protein, partial [Thermoanaerobaculia bacterium]|nr:site-2 protease family protein [Thermoanaerobaculia bacterium]